MKKTIARCAFGFVVSIFLATGAYARCVTTFDINLQTFGEGVLVELRAGSPGNSRVVSSRSSRGGHVGFSGLCPGNYFLAIGNDETISVTPVRYFEDYAGYSSTITLQKGSGNVSKRSRSSL